LLSGLARASLVPPTVEATPLDLSLFAGIAGNEETKVAPRVSGMSEVGQVEATSRRRSDLLTDFIPFDRGSLELAIDRFLEHFEDLGTGLSRWRGTPELVTEVLAVSIALAASTLALHYYERSSEDEAAPTGADFGANFEGYPGMPDPWSV